MHTSTARRTRNAQRLTSTESSKTGETTLPKAVTEVKRDALPKGEEAAYRRLRDARAEARYRGMREKRARLAAEAAEAAKK